MNKYLNLTQEVIIMKDSVTMTDKKTENNITLKKLSCRCK